MSDPVTNIDIEDVLSSIRRLVAEGSGSVTVPAAPPAESPREAAPATNGAAAEGRLILTPALRVHDGSRDESANGDSSAADMAAAVESTAPESAQVSDADSMVESAAKFDVPSEPAPAAEAAPQSDADRSRLEATIAELEAAVGEQSGDWDPDGSETVPVFDWATAEVVDGGFFTHRASADRTERAGTASGDDLSDVLTDPTAAGAEDAPVIDEEMLRSLIAEVVRQELQGALGERITRNVRKLVRREIYRVLSSQEFD